MLLKSTFWLSASSSPFWTVGSLPAVLFYVALTKKEHFKTSKYRRKILGIFEIHLSKNLAAASVV
jgi:hypothetical protein